MKHFLLVTILTSLIIIRGYSQEKKSTVNLTLFDEAGCISEARKNGMPESELNGYVNYKKLLHYYSLQYLTNPSKMDAPVEQGTLSADPCENTDFEFQNFNSWAADTGSIDYFSAVATYASGFSNVGNNSTEFNPLARHTILTIKPAVTTLPVPSPYTGYDRRLDFVDKKMPIDSAVTYIAPDGDNVSVRLGNATAGAGTERLKKTFLVDANSAAFTYSYAAILEDPGHPAIEQPRFTIRLLDQNGVLLPGPCSLYDVYAGKDSTYKTLDDTICTNSFFGPFCDTTSFQFKTWTTVGVDLTAYLGQQITIEFTTRDCSLGGHFGYAYIDAKCSSFAIKTNFCPGEKKAILTAPDGYVSYQWKDPKGNIIGNKQSVEISNPQLGEIYTVQLVAVTGCQTLLKSKIDRSPPPSLPSYEISQNVITPNGDGKNDLFKTSQFEYVGAFTIEIFNRWGLKVFESTDPFIEWDGKTNGKDLVEGTYYWMAKYQSTCYEDPADVISKGFVHVLR